MSAYQRLSIDAAEQFRLPQRVGVVIYVRHTKGCKYRADESAKRCACLKYLRWTHEGKRYRVPTGMRAWADAEKKKHEIEDRLARAAAPAPPVEDRPQYLSTAIEVFIQDKRVQGISADAIGKYTRELDRLRSYCEGRNVLSIQGVTREVLTGYCAGWEARYPSTQTRAIVRARCRSFLRYCYEAQWIPRIPPLPKIQVNESPTLPLTAGEYARLLAAIDLVFPDEARRQRTRALFQLMRWSGLALRDALTLERAEIQHDRKKDFYRVVTSRQKTGTHVSVPIRPDIAREVLAAPNDTWEHAANGAKCKGDPRYIFWDGESDIVQTWTKRVIALVFRKSGIARGGNMTSHRLRDTFAVDLLEKGVPMEEVSRLLGHASIRTTEKHYAKWSKGRQDRVDALVSGSWPTQKRGRGRPRVTK